MKKTKLISVNELHVSNKVTGLSIVNGVSFTLHKGEMLGIVGESGSGKSMTAQAIMNAIPTSLEMTGTIMYNEKQLHENSHDTVIYGKDICYIPQDYNSAFSSFYTIGNQLNEILRLHTTLTKKQRKERIYYMLEKVKLDPEKVYRSYHFQLSGGQLQRVVIASCMIVKPILLICDEITTALDGKNAEEILQLLKELQTESKTAVIFISHQLNQVLRYCDSLAVMYGGELMELGEKHTVQNHKCHPYTTLLLEAKPNVLAKNEDLVIIQGEPGNFHRGGCPFANRCHLASEKCFNTPVTLDGENHHLVACHHICHHHKRKEEQSNDVAACSIRS